MVDDKNMEPWPDVPADSPNITALLQQNAALSYQLMTSNGNVDKLTSANAALSYQFMTLQGGQA